MYYNICNWNITNFVAIPPPVSVKPFEINATAKASYDVMDGTEFSLICISFGTFSGRVIWNNERGKCIEKASVLLSYF